MFSRRVNVFMSLFLCLSSRMYEQASYLFHFIWFGFFLFLHPYSADQVTFYWFSFLFSLSSFSPFFCRHTSICSVTPWMHNGSLLFLRLHIVCISVYAWAPEIFFLFMILNANSKWSIKWAAGKSERVVFWNKDSERLCPPRGDETG